MHVCCECAQCTIPAVLSFRTRAACSACSAGKWPNTVRSCLRVLIDAAIAVFRGHGEWDIRVEAEDCRCSVHDKAPLAALSLNSVLLDSGEESSDGI